MEGWPIPGGVCCAWTRWGGQDTRPTRWGLRADLLLGAGRRGISMCAPTPGRSG